MTNATTELPGYLVFLSELLENVNQVAQDEEMGRVEYKIEQLQPNLHCVAARFIDDNEEALDRHEFFAAGFNRNFKIVRIKRLDRSEILVSADPQAILAILSY